MHDLFGLRDALVNIKTNDKNYPVRNMYVFQALTHAYRLGYNCGIRPTSNPYWSYVVIELPTGQVSWMVSGHYKDFDGHTTEEKYKRVDEFAALFNDKLLAGLPVLNAPSTMPSTSSTPASTTSSTSSTTQSNLIMSMSTSPPSQPNQMESTTSSPEPKPST
jgi:hypothetical protein